MKKVILELLENIDSDILMYQGTNMLADGIIDSFTLVEIVGVLEETFDIEINAQDVVIENFANKEKIIEYMEKRLCKES